MTYRLSLLMSPDNIYQFRLSWQCYLCLIYLSFWKYLSHQILYNINKKFTVLFNIDEWLIISTLQQTLSISLISLRANKLSPQAKASSVPLSIATSNNLSSNGN